MALENIFSKSVTEDIINRVNNLSSDTKAKWGKMDVSQMLAHVNVQYEMTYETIHKPIPGFVKFMLKTFVKNGVVNEKPYKQNSGTAPQMVIKTSKDFRNEKNRLVTYLNKAVADGEKRFDGKDHMAFGKLNKTEWNNLFYKHLDHHLNQFGV